MNDAETILRQKGWGRNEARKTADILAHAEASKSPSMQFLEHSVFWVALLVAIFGNLIISVVLVPFLLLLRGLGLYFTVFAVGITFGLLFNIIIGYIEKLNEGQHIIAGAFIPALALINIYLIAHFSNKLEILLQLPTPAHNPLGVSMTYVVAFVLPYLFKHFPHLKEKRL
ncbi:MAG: hypothetical protein QXT19_00270 [Candidatus Woesearchaeota archaeon]